MKIAKALCRILGIYFSVNWIGGVIFLISSLSINRVIGNSIFSIMTLLLPAILELIIPIILIISPSWLIRFIGSDLKASEESSSIKEIAEYGISLIALTLACIYFPKTIQYLFVAVYSHDNVLNTFYSSGTNIISCSMTSIFSLVMLIFRKKIKKMLI